MLKSTLELLQSQLKVFQRCHYRKIWARSVYISVMNQTNTFMALKSHTTERESLTAESKPQTTERLHTFLTWAIYGDAWEETIVLIISWQFLIHIVLKAKDPLLHLHFRHMPETLYYAIKSPSINTNKRWFFCSRTKKTLMFKNSAGKVIK